MPACFPRSLFGAILAVIYIAVAIYAVHDDRTTQGGGWISLNGMATAIVTFPVTLLGEMLGMKPDYRRNLDMVFAIGMCAMLVYFLGAGLAKLARALFAGDGSA